LYLEQSIIVFPTVNPDNSEKPTNVISSSSSTLNPDDASTFLNPDDAEYFVYESYPPIIQFLKTVSEERRAEVMAQYNASKSFGGYAKQDSSSNKAEKQGNINIIIFVII
jgi:hypothetical protein